MQNSMMPGRCMAAGCRDRATHAFAVLTPTEGFPIKIGSVTTTLFLTFYVCSAHTGAIKIVDVLDATARAIITKALMIKNASGPPDFNRASLRPTPLTDAEWIKFANSLRFRADKAQRPRAANDR